MSALPPISSVIVSTLKHYLGKETSFEFEEPLFHPNAVSFYNDSPIADFAGISSKPIFAANLQFSENDSDYHYCIERDGTTLVFIIYEEDSAGVFAANGQALECAKGSESEAVFLANAFASIIDDASGPLRAVQEAAKNVTLCLSSSIRAALALSGT